MVREESLEVGLQFRVGKTISVVKNEAEAVRRGDSPGGEVCIEGE